MSFRALVDLAKMRWRIERDYLELKQEIGLGHYEGRGLPGFRHHGTLCIAVYGFLISERKLISARPVPDIYALKSVAAQRWNRALSSLPAANQRQALSCRSLGAVHHGHERSEFGRMQASRRPNQR